MNRSLLSAAIVAGAMGTAMTGAFTGPASADEIAKKEFSIVGTWGNLRNWRDHESRLWNKVLPEATGGKLTANAKPYTELGLSGYEVVRLLKLGTYDAVHALTSYTSQDSPALEGIDLAGVIQDFDTMRKALDAYEPIIRRELRQKYNAELVMLYPFPSQQLFCKLDDKSAKPDLASLAGKKIRGYSTTLGDFVEGLGASSVTLAFAEVVPALQKGVADCGVTGTGPAYNAKWAQVVTHNIQVRVGFAATFLAFNGKVWDGLSEAQQKAIRENAKKVENDIWATQAENDATAMKCLAEGPCPWGEPGGIIPIAPSEDDNARLKKAVESSVLARFAKRCGKKCAEEWNETIGKVAGMKAPL
ncbi:MAG: TRAP transporter substrate-binding protein [Pseudomonadota bacterium]